MYTLLNPLLLIPLPVVLSPPPSPCIWTSLSYPSAHLPVWPQDMTTRLWDIRYPARSFALLKAHIGAVRSLRFSPCGRFLAAAEPADYVTIYDASQG
jgi:WD40 repeat protein